MERHAVSYVVTGSAAALLIGVLLEPRDLDVTPALDHENLERLAAALESVQAKQYAQAPFGRWTTREDGERKWVEFEPTETDRAERAAWRPDPDDPDSYDQLLRTNYGALDVVPVIAGTYDELLTQATKVNWEGLSIWVEGIGDQLATLTVPRREKDIPRVHALRAIQRRYFANPS